MIFLKKNLKSFLPLQKIYFEGKLTQKLTILKEKLQRLKKYKIIKSFKLLYGIGTKASTWMAPLLAQRCCFLFVFFMKDFSAGERQFRQILICHWIYFPFILVSMKTCLSKHNPKLSSVISQMSWFFSVKINILFVGWLDQKCHLGDEAKAR